jgi:hypothetical protein
MKLLIAVKSCQDHLTRGFHDAIRATWYKDAKAAGVDVRFFVGASPTQYLSDEVHVKCDDSYKGLPYKTREICRWVSGKLIDYTFFCDTDTYLHIPYLISSGFENYDYQGWMMHKLGVAFPYNTTDLDGLPELHPQCYTWASGGIGYFLSQRAAREVAYEHPSSWAEDLSVGQVVGPKIVAGELTARSTRDNEYHGNYYAWHFPRTEYDNQSYDPKFGWMEKKYAEQHG